MSRKIKAGKEYERVHKWLHCEYGKAERCLNPECDSRSKVINWALLKDKEYEKKRENFTWFCRVCHARYDITEESKRKIAVNNTNARKTHCNHGHPLSGENLKYYISPKGRKLRVCITCERRRGKDTFRRLYSKEALSKKKNETKF